MTKPVAEKTKPNSQLEPVETQSFGLGEAYAHQRVKEIVEDSGSSFFWAMRLLPKERREAIFAVYAFCREVDDIADEEGIDHEKREALNHWRSAISNLYSGNGTDTVALD